MLTQNTHQEQDTLRRLLVFLSVSKIQRAEEYLSLRSDLVRETLCPDVASRDDVFRWDGVTPAVAPSTLLAGHDPVLRQPIRGTVISGGTRK